MANLPMETFLSSGNVSKSRFRVRCFAVSKYYTPACHANFAVKVSHGETNQ